MLIKKYTLITPNDAIIDHYNAIWNGENEGIDKMQLFNGHSKIDVKDFDCIKGKNYKKMDDDISSIVKEFKEDCTEEKCQKVVAIINRTYNTMITDTKKTAKNIFKNSNELFEFINSKEYVNAVNMIACVDKKENNGKYIYSFATKLCSFLSADKKVPIFDSISSTLICKWLKDKEEKVSHSKMGNYGYYCSKYCKFKDLYKITKDNKETDIFIWLYGKIIQEYWKRVGVIAFGSVYYLDPSKNKGTNELLQN